MQWGLQPYREYLMEPLFGRAIMTMDGDYHQRSRAIVRPTFAKSKVSDLAFLEKLTNLLLTKLPTNGSTIDLQPLFLSLVCARDINININRAEAISL